MLSLSGLWGLCTTCWMQNHSLLAVSAVKTMSLCSSRQSWKAAHVREPLPMVTWPFTPAHKSCSCISRETRSQWDCGSPDRRFLGSLCVLAIALLCCFWLLGASSGSPWSPTCGPPHHPPTRQCSWTQKPSRDPSTSRSASQQPFWASCTVSQAPSAWWCIGLQQCVQGIPHVPTGVDGHVEDGPVRKLDLQTLRFFLCGYKNCWWDVWNGWPTAQLPFLHSKSFNPPGALRVVLILHAARVRYWAWASWKKTSAKLVETQPEFLLQNAKFLGPKKTLTCANSTRKTGWKAWYRKTLALAKTHCLTWAGF